MHNEYRTYVANVWPKWFQIKNVTETDPGRVFPSATEVSNFEFRAYRATLTRISYTRESQT